MMEHMVYFTTEIIKKASRYIHYDVAYFGEDIAYKTGPLISPEMFNRFMVPRYQKITDLLRNVGVSIIIVDSDGNIEKLIPFWLKSGFNGVVPLEAAAGMNAVSLRKKYGNDLMLMGNIDKRAIARGKEAIREEVLGKVPFLLKTGGYFPCIDHMIPPDISFENFCYFVNLLREIGGLGKLPI